jgi:mannose-6-phosphate isomerase-like protein (cupin superfamily)
MVPEIIDTRLLAASVTRDYDNRPIATTDDHVVRMGVMTQPYFWHRHDCDETFLVLEGCLEIAFEDGAIELAEGQMASVPAGIVHCTRPLTPRTVNLTFEHAHALTERVDPPVPSA